MTGEQGYVPEPDEIADVLAMKARRVAMEMHRRAVVEGRATLGFLELPLREREAAIAAATEFVETAHAAGMLATGVNPRAVQSPQTCDHPGAYVHANVGRPPRWREDPDCYDGHGVQWRLSADGAGERRAGEELSAGLGECSACGSLVGQLDTWHPDDVAEESVRVYASRWVGLYVLDRDGEHLVDAHESAEPREARG